MKCDSCTRLVCDPPTSYDPWGYYGCGAGHWEGRGEPIDETNLDPWKWCEDYEENT